MSRFKQCLALVKESEGGFSDHPADPGGATMKGVTQRVYDAYRKGAGMKPRSVRAITNAEVEAIYRAQYWDAIRADELPPGVDYVVFDGAVNSGPSQAARWLQRALGVKADGVIGKVTLVACREHPDHEALIDAMCDDRMRFLRSLRTWRTFGRGWAARVASVREAGKAWATGGMPEAPQPAAAPSAKARPEDLAVAKTPTGIAQAVAGVSGTAIAVSQVVKSATEAGQAGAEAVSSARRLIEAMADPLILAALGAAVVIAAGVTLWKRARLAREEGV